MTAHEEEHFYYPMFFCVDKPMEEFFSECIQLLNKTWKDMRATKEDFSKVRVDEIYGNSNITAS